MPRDACGSLAAAVTPATLQQSPARWGPTHRAEPLRAVTPSLLSKQVLDTGAAPYAPRIVHHSGGVLWITKSHPGQPQAPSKHPPGHCPLKPRSEAAFKDRVDPGRDKPTEPTRRVTCPQMGPSANQSDGLRSCPVTGQLALGRVMAKDCCASIQGLAGGQAIAATETSPPGIGRHTTTRAGTTSLRKGPLAGPVQGNESKIPEEGPSETQAVQPAFAQGGTALQAQRQVTPLEKRGCDKTPSKGQATSGLLGPIDKVLLTDDSLSDAITRTAPLKHPFAAGCTSWRRPRQSACREQGSSLPTGPVTRTPVAPGGRRLGLLDSCGTRETEAAGDRVRCKLRETHPGTPVAP